MLLIFVQEGSWKKLDFIPKKYMGVIIGRNREQLNDIEQNTGAKLKAGSKGKQDGALYIKGPIESQKRAIRKIKEIVVSVRTCQRYYFEIILKEITSKIRHLPKIFLNSSELEWNKAFSLITRPAAN